MILSCRLYIIVCDDFIVDLSPVCFCQITFSKFSISYTHLSGTYDISVYYDGVKEAEVTNVKLDPEHNTLQLNCDVMTSGSSIVIAP